MPPKWIVRSVHINIGTGDSAIHFLVDVSNGQRKIHSSVLIDGGHAGQHGRGAYAVDNFLKSLKGFGNVWEREDGRELTVFDTIVVTHWDGDHYGGVINLFILNFEKRIKEEKITDVDKLKKEILEGKWQSPYAKYDASGKTPLTLWFAPYSARLDSQTKPVPLNEVPDRLIHIREDYTIDVKVKFEVEGQDVQVLLIPIAQWVPFSQGHIGRDFFEPTKLIPQDSLKSPQTISRYLYDQNTTKPSMVCVVSDSRICDDGNKVARKALNWYVKDWFKEVCIAEQKPSTDWLKYDFPAYVHGQDASDVSTRSIPGINTGNNESSIACMIIWPNAVSGNVSHYFGGDLGDPNEDDVIRWSLTPDDKKNPKSMRKNVKMRVRAMKLSHHGRSGTLLHNIY